MTVRRIPSKRSKTMQYVKVDLDGKAYTYGWTGVEPLKRGDRVEVPANVVNPEPSVRTVLRAMPGPDYDVDKIVNILSKVEVGQAVDIGRPGPVDPVLYDGDGNMSFPPTSHLTELDEKMDSIFTDEAQNEAIAASVRRNLTAGLPEGDPSADAGNDRTFAEANPGVDLGRPEPHDWDDLIGDLGDDSAAEKFDDYVAEVGYDDPTFDPSVHG